jgi:hypothetical protein
MKQLARFDVPLMLALLASITSTVSIASMASEAVFDAANTGAADGLRLVSHESAPFVPQDLRGQHVVGAAPNGTDYYTRHGVAFRVPDNAFENAKSVYAVVEHLDEDVAFIEMSYDAADKTKSAAGMAGYTALGLGQKRRALFRLDAPAFQHRLPGGADVCVYGLTAITRITLSDTLAEGVIDAIRAETPDRVEPLVQLKRPMELVLGTGETPEQMRELCILAARLGFNGVEGYVRWGDVEKERGKFDWSHYDAHVLEAKKHGLKWLPLLIVGSAYTLPDWFHDSPENVGFVCLEHGKSNNIQTIFCENQTPYVKRFLEEFGKHYEPMDALLAVRLGPSGNYGESQYPAGGNWGYKSKAEHIHIGWWAGDKFAAPKYQAWLQRKYGSVDALNKAWSETFPGFDAVRCVIPQFADTPRQRKDMEDWYVGEMTDWCERWAVWAHEALPNTFIYQSAGGWGFEECGTDFTGQTRSMKKVNGGIRATNETDSYAQDFEVTRMMSSAARFYGVAFGSEPASSNTVKGFAARMYNLLVNNGRHFFQYGPNLTSNDQAVAAWRELAPLMDRRDNPFIEVAVAYPETLSRLDDGVFRNLYSSGFYPRVEALRSHLDFDFCSEQMMLDGALPRYKVLVLLWSHIIEKNALDVIDAWVRDGGIVIEPYWARWPLSTVEGDSSVFQRWLAGDTGKGKAVLFQEDREPAHLYADGVYKRLLELKELDPRTQAMLRTEKPYDAYVSVLQNGAYAVLNYTGQEAMIRVPGLAETRIAPYRFALIDGKTAQ